MASTLDEALRYASYGWRVIPLHHVRSDGKCSCGNECGKSTGKHPRFSDWQISASSDEMQISDWWDEYPEANVGVAFGEASGIIDIECDSPDIESYLTTLFGGEFPVCPTFTSGRGKHRLFRWTDDLPCQDKALFKIRMIEFRTGNAGGAQSVFPPSTHYSGKPYSWLVDPSEVDAPEIPRQVLDRIWTDLGYERGSLSSGRSIEEWEKLADGVGEGDRHNTALAMAGKMLSAIDVHNNDFVRIQWILLQKWNHGNRPEMDEDELKKIFNDILKKERARRTENEYTQAISEYVDQNDPGKPGAEQDPMSGWRLVIVRAKPRYYKLYSPIWSTKAEGGYIELTTDQLMSVALLRKQIVDQAEVNISRKKLDVIWNGTPKKKGLFDQLLASADTEEPPAEEHRDRIVAQMLIGELSRATDFDPDKGHMGGVQILSDGSYILKFEKVFDKYRFGPEGLKRNELSKMIQKVGGKDWKGPDKNGDRSRYKRLPSDAIDHLEWLVTGCPVSREQGQSSRTVEVLMEKQPI